MTIVLASAILAVGLAMVAPLEAAPRSVSRQDNPSDSAAQLVFVHGGHMVPWRRDRGHHRGWNRWQRSNRDHQMQRERH